MISIYLFFFHFISIEREVTQIYQIDCFKDLFCHILFYTDSEKFIPCFTIPNKVKCPSRNKRKKDLFNL